MGQYSTKGSAVKPDDCKVGTPSQNPPAASKRCSRHTLINVQNGHFHRFDSHHSNFDDEIDQTLSRHSLLPHSGDLDRRQNNYGSIQESSNTEPEALPSHSSSIQPSEAKSSIEKLPFAMINIIVMLIYASGRFHHPLVSQYLYQRYADTVLRNASVKTSSHPCVNVSSSDPTTAMNVRKVQQMTSAMLLYLDLSNYCIGIPACLVLGALANSLSRKQLLSIPIFGYLVKCLMIVTVVCWHLNVNWFFLGYAAEGILGNVSGFFFGAFLYTSDITSRDKKRTMGVSIVEGLKGILAAGLNSVTGQLIQKTGFVVPAILSMGCVVLSLVGVLLLPTRKPSLQFDCLGDCTGPISCWYKRLSAPFNAIADKHVKKLVVVGGIAFLLAYAAVVGVSKVETLYIMNMPFCFDAVNVGWYMFGRELAYNGLLIIAVPLLYNCMPGMWLGILGSLSALLGSIMYAVATTDVEIYHVILLAMGQYLPICMIRGESSRLFGPEAQGPLFAIFAMLECAGSAMGTSALSVYRASLDIYKGMAFVVFASVMAIVTVMLCFYQVIWKRHLLDNLVKELRLKSARIFA